MGTNYYATPAPFCPTCGCSDPAIHIGKSSAGWAFLFHGYEDEKLTLTTAKEWFEHLQGREIKGEYGCIVSIDDFKTMVARKKHDRIAWSDRKQLDPEGHPVAFYEFS
ncbi:hypothetical protein [Bradyrhizobium sp. th.b2]|nr:hypothetical protein [Bradyrhizobium sp. th.b2]